MKKLLPFCVVVISAISHPLGAAPKWETYNCEYMDLATDISLTGRCHKEDIKINDNFGYQLIWPSGNTVTVEYVGAQSGHHVWKINGKSAAAIEITRENLRGFSLDLNQFLEWQDNP
jgi:hypothetical protein